MKPEAFQLFVYGSLRSGFKSPAYEYISRFFTFLGEGTVKGKLYDMGSYPAGVSTNEDLRIKGELYRINNPHEFSWAIGQLDDYEGVSVDFDEVQLYRREFVEVEYRGGKTGAWVYWYNGTVEGRPEIPSGDLVEYLGRK